MNPADESLITHPLQHCPRCGSDRLEPVVERSVQAVHFLCQECGRCWHVELGAVSRVPPPTCFGCPARGRCLEMYALDHPDLQNVAD
jgi:transposase-like protein